MRLLTIFSVLLLTLTAKAQILPIYGGERAGLSTLSFLKTDMSTRSTGMGGASVANTGDAYSVINNPAALTHLRSTSVALSHLFLGAGINQSFASGIFPLDDVSNLGVSVNSLNSGDMEERTEFQPQGTGRSIVVSNMALGLTYSRQLSALFSAGVTVKYIYEGIAGYSNSNATVDVAFLYETDFKDLKFAVMVQNFGGNSSLSSDDDDLPVVFNRTTGISLDANVVPTIFKLGASFKPYNTEQQSITASAQLNHPNDNAENYRLGVEYEYMEIFFARAGYKISVRDQDYPTFGIGVRARIGGFPLYIDYAANPTNYLGIQNNIGLRINIINDSRE